MKKKSKKKEPQQSPRKRKIVLGRGLDALIPIDDNAEDERGEFFHCDVELIRSNPFQPRQRFSEEDLSELAQSIEQQGILQPLLVRRSESGFELITGERRLRAAKRAGLHQVPVVIKDINDEAMLEMSIIENIQRENLNPMEEAEAYHRLITDFDLTQDQAALRVGKSRPAVANILRLRQLPDPIKSSIIDGVLTMGHARALLGVDTVSQQTAAWRTVVSKGLSVRQTEALIKRIKAQTKEPKKRPETSEEIYLSDLADDLSRQFGTRVQIRRKGKKGKIEIDFYSNDDLDRLIGLLNQQP
ncbi:MAG TPA: ParB/RepB/Spo0J family partition protein [Deltaproteobacteria bacterium]|nr:ParB/RepB/Spo0J family partition protein [Deltaproteobacteria bacterium]